MTTTTAVAQHVSARLRRMATSMTEPRIIARAGAPNNYAGLDLALHWTNQWRQDAILFSVFHAGQDAPASYFMDQEDVTRLIHTLSGDEGNPTPVLLDLVEATDQLITMVRQIAHLTSSSAPGPRSPLPANADAMLAAYLTMGELA